MAIAVRQCSALNASGEPCGSPPMRDSDLCSVHNPASPVAASFASGHPPMPGGGRPKVRRWHEIVNKAMEERAEEFVAPYLAALHGDDADLAMRAVERLLDRLDGKPTQRSEVDHSGSIGLDLLLADQPNDNDENHKFEAEEAS